MTKEYKINEKWRSIYGEDLVTAAGRAQFVHLLAPTSVGESKPKYSINICMSKECSEVEKKYLTGIQEQCKDLFLQLTKFLHEVDTKAKKTKLSLEDYRAEYKAKIKYPIFRDGDISGDYEGYEGSWIIVAKNADINRVRILDGKTASDIQSGLKVRIQVQPQLGEQGFSYGLSMIKVVEDDGVRFAGGAAKDLLSNLDEAVAAVSMNQSNGTLETAYDKAVTQSAPSGLDVL